MRLFNKPDTYLFVFILPDSYNFWLYANGGYHRLVWREGSIRYVRSQAYLPAYVTGSCLEFNYVEREALEREVNRHGISIRFSPNPQDCYPKSSSQGEGYVFGLTPSTHYFYFDGNMERRYQA